MAPASAGRFQMLANPASSQLVLTWPAASMTGRAGDAARGRTVEYVKPPAGDCSWSRIRLLWWQFSDSCERSSSFSRPRYSGGGLGGGSHERRHSIKTPALPPEYRGRENGR